MITIRMPARYARQAPRTVVPNPIVSEFTPAIGLFGMTTPYAMTRVGRTNATNGPKYVTLMPRTYVGGHAMSRRRAQSVADFEIGRCFQLWAGSQAAGEDEPSFVRRYSVGVCPVLARNARLKGPGAP